MRTFTPLEPIASSGRLPRNPVGGFTMNGNQLVENLTRDARHMARGLRKSPVFTITVVLTLALGIGGNTAIFSVVDQLLLRPLPYPDGDRLVTVYESLPFVHGNDRNLRNSVSPANWLDWQSENHTLQGIAAWRTFTLTLTGVGDPLRLNAQLVSSEFFPLLGVPPLLGRTLSEADDQPNAPPVAVLSYQLWQRRFGGDAAVIGRVVQLNDRPAEIVGVMPAHFRFVYQDTDLWGAQRLNRTQPWRQTAGRFISVVARIKQDSSIAAARTDLESIAARLASIHEFNKNTSVTLVPLREELTGQVRIVVAGALRGRRRPVVDWLLQRRQPAGGACLGATARGGAAHRARRRPAGHCPAAPRRKPVARHGGWRPWPLRGALDTECAAGLRPGRSRARARVTRLTGGSCSMRSACRL